ncbi:MAG: S-adenosylmethionine:tRNA ribosyltransferase-isomerase, partial [Gilliamella sp.]|nr:S-adenosylmethionine:tRNA ribosyltransferase-isomerase [Gilliamella sp.]
MQLSDFDFYLPKELIAKHPSKNRSACRLLSLDSHTGKVEDNVFTDIIDKINPGDLLIFNNTKVIPARLYGKKASGGKIEILIERILDNNRALAHIRATKSPKAGAELIL